MSNLKTLKHNLTAFFCIAVVAITCGAQTIQNSATRFPLPLRLCVLAEKRDYVWLTNHLLAYKSQQPNYRGDIVSYNLLNQRQIPLLKLSAMLRKQQVFHKDWDIRKLSGVVVSGDGRRLLWISSQWVKSMRHTQTFTLHGSEINGKELFNRPLGFYSSGHLREPNWIGWVDNGTRWLELRRGNRKFPNQYQQYQISMAGKKALAVTTWLPLKHPVSCFDQILMTKNKILVLHEAERKSASLARNFSLDEYHVLSRSITWSRQYRVLTPEGYDGLEPFIISDGRSLLWTTKRREGEKSFLLFFKSNLTGGEIKEMLRTSLVNFAPDEEHRNIDLSLSSSPDGQFISFVHMNTLWVASVSGSSITYQPKEAGVGLSESKECDTSVSRVKNDIYQKTGFLTSD